VRGYTQKQKLYAATEALKHLKLFVALAGNEAMIAGNVRKCQLLIDEALTKLAAE
jgi:hypothetical protein